VLELARHGERVERARARLGEALELRELAHVAAEERELLAQEPRLLRLVDRGEVGVGGAERSLVELAGALRGADRRGALRGAASDLDGLDARARFEEVVRVLGEVGL